MPPQRLYRTRGIVLRRRDFDEADRLLTVLTRDRGKVSLLAKGARKITSRKAPHVELFREVDLLVHQGRNFGIVSQAECLKSFPHIMEVLERMASAHYLAELTDGFLGEDDEATGVYDLLLEALTALDQECDPRLVERYFELHLLDLCGFRPQLYRCLACDTWLEETDNVFDAATGGTYCPSCGGELVRGVRASIGAQKVLRYMQRSELDSCRSLSLRATLHDEMENLLGDYTRHILDRNLKSRRFEDAVRDLPAET